MPDDPTPPPATTAPADPEPAELDEETEADIADAIVALVDALPPCESITITGLGADGDATVECKSGDSVTRHIVTADALAAVLGPEDEDAEEMDE